MVKKLERKQFLPISIEEAWAYFQDPNNLNYLTPKSLSFTVLSVMPPQVYEGLMIYYRLKPMLNIPVKWLTEITHVKAPYYFVDEQRQGPYKLWHHEHHFKQVEGGVEMTDILHYDIGKSIFGSIAGALFVHKKVQEIFDYRYKILAETFK